MTLGTFAINVSFSVPYLVFTKLKKSAEFFVFLSALVYVFGKDSEEYPKGKT